MAQSVVVDVMSQSPATVERPLRAVNKKPWRAVEVVPLRAVVVEGSVEVLRPVVEEVVVVVIPF